jgi:hypothetical protein
MTLLPAGTRVGGEAAEAVAEAGVIEGIEAEVAVVEEVEGIGEEEDAVTKEDGGVGSVRVGARLPRVRGR